MILLEIKAFIIMINKELKLKYIKSLKSGGKVPKYLTAWGKLDRQNKLDDWTKHWFYRATDPSAESTIVGGWKPGSRNGHVESDEEYTARRTKEEQDSAKKRTKHIKKAADTAHMIGTLALPAGIAASAAVSLPATLGGIAGGIAGEKAVDWGLGKLADMTGSQVRSWKDLTDKYLGLSPTLLMLSNPGVLLGGGVGAKTAAGTQKVAQFIASNLTGKWVPFLGREWRILPGTLGINNVFNVESRRINPVYRNVDHMLENTLEMDDGMLYSGSNNAASVTRTTPQRVAEIVQQHPNTVSITPLMNGRYALQEIAPGAFRDILLENEQLLASKGLIPERVQPRQTTRISLLVSLQPVLTAYENETLRRMPEGSLVSATDTRIANIPKEELAKKGIGLDMSLGGTPYAESDIFLPNGEVKPGIDLRLFHKSKPGSNNVAYWYPKGKDFNDLPIEELARARVGTYFGATLNRLALRDEAQRIAMHNPTNVSGAYGYLSDFDLNPNSFKSMLGNLRMQVQAGRNLRLLERPNDEYPFLIPNQFNQAGRYIEEIDPQLKLMFMDHYSKHEKIASELLMDKIFGKGNATLGQGNIPVSTGVMNEQEFSRRLANYLEQKASFRRKFITPNNLIFTRTNEGYRITGDASLGNQDFGILRPNNLDNQYADLMKSVNTFRLRTGLNIPSPKIIDEGNAGNLVDNAANLPGKFRFIGIPNITIFTHKKGGKIK